MSEKVEEVPLSATGRSAGFPCHAAVLGMVVDLLVPLQTLPAPPVL